MFLDIAFGIIIGLGTAATFGWEQAVLLIFGGVVFALLPDIDALYLFARKRNISAFNSSHRDLLHYPLVYILIGALSFSFFGVAWVVLFVFASLAHFIHDSIGIGWGVKWLFPFTKNNYKFFYNDHGNHGKLNYLFIFTPQKLRIYEKKYGNPHWIRDTYGQISRTMIIEVVGLVVAVIVMVSIFILYKSV